MCIAYIYIYVYITYEHIYTLCVSVNRIQSWFRLANFLFVYVFLIYLALGSKKLGLLGSFRSIFSKIRRVEAKHFLCRLQLLLSWEECPGKLLHKWMTWRGSSCHLPSDISEFSEESQRTTADGSLSVHDTPVHNLMKSWVKLMMS